MGYPAMLGHADHSWGSPGFCCAGSAAVPGRAVVRARHSTGDRGAGVGRQPDDRLAPVSPLAGGGPASAAGRRTGRAQAASGPATVGPGGSRLAQRARGAWLRHRSVDVAPHGDRHRATHSRALSPRACLAHPPGLELVAATARPPGAGTRRGGDPAVAAAALAPSKKNARRRRAWIVFEDESGVSQQPVVRRTWAPRGQTPCLRHTGANWKRLSIAATLAFRWDGRRSRLYFQTRPGTYTDGTLITFLRTVKRHFRGQRVVLIWDGLGAHKSGRMLRYLHAQRRWLQVERLPAYAPELNPVELLWGNLKGRTGEPLSHGRTDPPSSRPGWLYPYPPAPRARPGVPPSCGPGVVACVSL
jgi:hypothetical protein